MKHKSVVVTGGAHQHKKSEANGELILKMEDIFDLNFTGGRKAMTINVEAMSLLIAEGKGASMVSEVVQDIIKLNQILSGQGKKLVTKPESEREIVHMLTKSFDI